MKILLILSLCAVLIESEAHWRRTYRRYRTYGPTRTYYKRTYYPKTYTRTYSKYPTYSNPITKTYTNPQPVQTSNTKTYPSSHSSVSYPPVSASYLLQPASQYYMVPSKNVDTSTKSVNVPFPNDPDIPIVIPKVPQNLPFPNNPDIPIVIPKVPQNLPFPNNPDIPIVIPKVPQDLPEDFPEDFDPELAELANFLDIFPDSDEEEVIPVAKPNNVIEVISKSPNLKNLATLVQGLGLVETLSTAAQVTILAPSDQAFSFGSTTMLKDLKRHVIGVKLTSDSIETGPVATLSGDVLNLVKDPTNSKITIEYNGKMINVVEADISASNGIIHVVDQVIQ